MAGSVENRGNNKWRLTVSGGFDGEGNRIKHRRNVTVKSRNEAKKHLAKFVTEIETGVYAEPSKFTVQLFCEKWLKEYARPNLTPKTVYRYESLLRRIYAEFGHLKLEQVKPIHLMAFYRKLGSDGARIDGKNEGLASKTVDHHHKLLSKIFKDAIHWQLIPYSPVDRIKPPKVTKKDPIYYNESEIKALLKALDDEPIKYKLIFHLLIFTGARRGEVLGLEWKHIDFKNKEIKIEQSLSYVPKQGTFIKSTKTEKSNRRVTITDSLIKLLNEYSNWQEEQRLDFSEMNFKTDFIFTDEEGKNILPDTVNMWFTRFLKRKDLPHINIHGLRHTNATLLISQGLDIQTVSSRLGHAQTVYNSKYLLSSIKKV